MPNNNMEEKEILNPQTLQSDAIETISTAVEVIASEELAATEAQEAQPVVLEDNAETTSADAVGLTNSVVEQAKEQTNEAGEVLNETPINEELDGIEEAKWYVLHTFSGYENVAKENLEIVIDKYNLQNRIFDIVIPTEDVIEEKNGKRKVVTRKLMPGYILVKMRYGDDIWHAVAARTRGITGFVGPKGRPLNLTEEEIRKMHLEKVTVIDVNLAVNDKVEVLDGPLNGFAGTVVSVDAANSKCRVVVEMFGRETPVDLSLTQVRKLI